MYIEVYEITKLCNSIERTFKGIKNEQDKIDASKRIDVNLKMLNRLFDNVKKFAKKNNNYSSTNQNYEEMLSSIYILLEIDKYEPRIFEALIKSFSNNKDNFFYSLDMMFLSVYYFKEENNLKRDYFVNGELSNDEILQILKAINMKRKFNIMTTSAMTGNAIKGFKMLVESLNHEVVTYALANISLTDDVDRYIKGGMVGSRISNNTFDILYLDPPFDLELKQNHIGVADDKEEKIYLKNHTKLLRNEGILIYTIPFNRLSLDLIYILSKNFKNVKVLKRVNNITEKSVIIIANKKNPSDSLSIDEELYNYLINVEYANLKSVYDLEDNVYELANGNIKEPDLFRGSSIDLDSLKKFMQTDGLDEAFLKESKESNIKETRPLLPFNIGQIGLILTSGCLDGKIEETKGHYHAIKGRVVSVETKKTVRENRIEKENIIKSNKIQINVLSPDGKLIELA